MLLRNTAFVLGALLFVAAGCGDTPTRATGPRDAQVLLNQTPEQNSFYVQWLKDFTEAGGNLQGQALSALNDIQEAADKGAALNALIAYMMANYADLNAPAQPRGGTEVGTDLDSQLALFFTAVAQYHGLIGGLGDGFLDVEHLVTIVTAADFTDTDANGNKCFPTDEGNAAMCLNVNSLNFPAFVSIIEQETGETTTFPPGLVQAGKIFHYDAYGSVTGDVVVLLCAPKNHDHSTNYGLARSNHGQNNFVEKTNNAGTDFPGACEAFQAQAPLMNGDSWFARGVNAAGSFVLSALTPKSLYATHSLAHRGTAFSDWTLVEVNAVEVKVVGVNSGTFTPTSFNVGRNTGNITFYVEVYLNGVLETCGADNTNIVKAEPKFAANLTGVEVTGTACSFHGSTGTHRHQITFTNLRQGTSVTNGSIAFTVNGFTATGLGGSAVTFTTN